MIGAALRRLRLVEPAPPLEIEGEIAAGDQLIASALSNITWTVIRVGEFGGHRMISLRWNGALILRDEAELRRGKEGWKRA